MKHFLQSPDSSLRIDPTIQKTLLDFIPGRVDSMADADYCIVPISYMADFVFSAPARITKPVVCFDFLEFGWCAGDKENRLEHLNETNFEHLNTPEWAAFFHWLHFTPPALTFKRELFQRDVSDRMLPVEFPCRLPIPPIQTEAEFNARPYECFFCWGHSHPSRPRLHGQIFEAMADKGINVFSDWSHIGPKEGRTWVSIYSPHWARRPIEDVMAVQSHSKISVSLFGAGQKSFRDSEAPVGSIMARPHDELAWSYPWIHGVDCIRIHNLHEYHELEHALIWNNLYDIYCQGQNRIAQYASETYTRDYIVPIIENIL